MKPETLRAWIAAAGGRRFLLTLGAGVMSSVLLACGQLTSGDYVLVVLGTVGAYIAGNSWQKKKAAE